jgi:hypothetical protein
MPTNPVVDPIGWTNRGSLGEKEPIIASLGDIWRGQARIIVAVEGACPLRQLLRGVLQYLPHQQHARFRPRKM